MKHSKTTIILTVLISISLFVVGLLSFGKIYEILLPKIDNGFYQVTELGRKFKTSLIFSLILGLTPVVILTTWRLASITINRQRMLSVLTVVICMVLAILVGQQLIKSYFIRPTNSSSSTSDNLIANYPLDKVYFEYYMLAGICIGCLISYFLFRAKK